MGILCWSLVRETPRCLRPSPLPVWQLLLLLSLRLSPKLLLIPTFCMVDMEDIVVDMVDMVLDMVDMDMDTMDIMASVRLRLSPRLLLIPTFCMVDMAVILDMLDLDMPTTDKLYLTPTAKWTANHTSILVSLVSVHI